MKSFKVDKEASTKQLNWFKQHKLLTIILIFIGLGVIGSATGGTKPTSTGSPQSSSSNNQAASIAKIGQAARDGKFEFTVTSLECGKTKVGSEFLNRTAQGQFCMINVTIKNIGNEKQTLYSQNQKAFDAQGREFTPDDTAMIYASTASSSTWLQDINPGNSVSGAIIFDVPKDATLVTAELHDSTFSGGVKVSLQ